MKMKYAFTLSMLVTLSQLPLKSFAGPGQVGSVGGAFAFAASETIVCADKTSSSNEASYVKITVMKTPAQTVLYVGLFADKNSIPGGITPNMQTYQAIDSQEPTSSPSVKTYTLSPDDFSLPAEKMQIELSANGAVSDVKISSSTKTVEYGNCAKVGM